MNVFFVAVSALLAVRFCQALTLGWHETPLTLFRDFRVRVARSESSKGVGSAR